MFDMPDGQEIDEPDIHKISEDLEVTVSIKPKIRQDAKSVLIKSQERHASAMYEARHRLLKIDDDEEDLVKAEVPEAYKIQPITAQTLSNIGKFSFFPTFFTSLIVARSAHLSLKHLHICVILIPSYLFLIFVKSFSRKTLCNEFHEKISGNPFHEKIYIVQLIFTKFFLVYFSMFRNEPKHHILSFSS